MPLPDNVRRQAELLLFAFCQFRVPASVQPQYRLAFRTRMNTITLYESYGPWNPKFPKSSRTPCAQFRYDLDRQVWVLYWADRNEQWHLYDGIEPTPDLAELIAEVHEDSRRVFFG